jgi:hypothetical protein
MATQRGTGGIPTWVWWAIGIVVLLVILFLVVGPMLGPEAGMGDPGAPAGGTGDPGAPGAPGGGGTTPAR